MYRITIYTDLYKRTRGFANLLGAEMKRAGSTPRLPGFGMTVLYGFVLRFPGK
jgi:hypothetical protein